MSLRGRGGDGARFRRFSAPRVGLRYLFPSGLGIDLRFLAVSEKDSAPPRQMHIVENFHMTQLRDRGIIV